MKIAIVHEYLVKMGGAERVLKDVSELFPNADIFCLVDLQNTPELGLDRERIHCLLSFLPKFILKRYQLLVSLYPLVIENLNLSEYDLVISLNNSFSHGVITNSQTCHVAYYHSPMRFIWDYWKQYPIDLNMGRFKRIIWSLIAKKLRVWDFIASQRPDYRIAISNVIKGRIRKYYRSSSKVINPPVNTEQFKPKAAQDFYLIISRLSKYKNIDLAIKGFNKLGKKLIIAGTGKEEDNLRKIADSNVELLGYVSEEKRIELFETCKGFIVLANEEDFGITPIEAMACGKPVLAYRDGALLETIQEGKHGTFFDNLTEESFLEGFAKFEEFIEHTWSAKENILQARKFSADRFRTEFLDYLESAYMEKTGKKLIV